mmetsp:Transcript_29843/g.45566  ORF Transcript_29843/g.45566 Transcript_29843/m.45566 type:complete len:93 (+) Transcript_29843:1048-1326(+)|eukprot:CAMPEP_0170499052 /NCGR_PEP_ID=MMETSP0208-20121228/29876_1 /TAXON_ID=197538 /ORGANISM="Strombidium inclinatum, Strain S3" /LENGTH=92 /DNA_ID=CAMNT_0010776435 /DNA_START=996 /DNA_END=1274 /DNA_ORIENTATION=+
MHTSVAPEDKLDIPMLAVTPSRCVQFMNMISPGDLYDAMEILRVKDDLVSECENFGDVISLEIPTPKNIEIVLKYNEKAASPSSKIESSTSN